MLNKAAAAAAAQSRRFVNVVMEKYRSRGGNMYSLSRIKAHDEHLFYPSTEEAAQKEARRPWMDMEERISRLPVPKIRFQSPVSTDRDVDFLPLYGRGSSNESKILCANQAGHTLFYDADSGLVEVVPSLNAPKGHRPIALSINRADASDSSRADVLYVLKTVPVEASLRQCNFEALVYGDASNSVFKRPDRYAWHWVPLPPPPFVDDPDYDPIRILSHALLDGDICISTAGLGTYSFDTASCKWTKAGRWKLPFYGRAHYVPELNLLFGITDRRPHHLCAVDLASASKARAPREHDWPDLAIPEDWVLSDTTMVYLGAGRFCIAKVFDIVR